MRKIFLLFLFLPGFLFSQIIFEPSYSSVYNFLNRLSVKGVFIFNDELRPVSRIRIAEKLIEAECNLEELTSTEREELMYYKRDFNPEILIIRNSDQQKTIFFNDDSETGFRPFLYRDKNFSITADPILGFTYRRQYGDNFNHRFNGFTFSGYYQQTGFNFYFRDNEEIGNTIDVQRKISPETGIVRHSYDGKNLQYSFVRGLVSHSWSWGNVNFGKEDLEWGSGRRGQLILSSKAPSFPFIRLILEPTHWLQFQYVHGWLQSGIIDSNSVRETLVPGRKSYSQVGKYIASHIISLYPLNNLSFSVGESIIYSDKLEPFYFIPVLFFRLADHYNSDSGDNAQIFANAVFKFYPLRAKLYGTYFIDELSLTDVLEGGNLSSTGFTIGLNFVDPVIKNSEIILEYTRINPFVYMNSDDVQLYTSHNYQLGHWIGSNADQFYFSYNQWILRGLKINLWGEFIRKGQTELPVQQYQSPYPDILYGSRLNMKTAGIEIHYEIFRNLFGRMFYKYSDISDEEIGRTLEFKLGSNNIFGFLISYGL
ncbi:MAG TPA: capsule assembly Wzi family protein [Ignavibacteriaceae bacterium]|nr:capsule assembly Wzi family protein [Ignavibacteriaceae bacterium]